MYNQRIPLEEWVKSNPEIEKLLVEIQNMPISVQAQAQIAFDRLAELLGLPKVPDDIHQNEDNEEKQGQRSLYEEYALLKYLKPDDDPRGLVLSGVFHLLNGIRVDYKEVVNKEYNGVIPKDCVIGIRGEGINSEVVFPKEENKSWYELGCKVAVKL